MKLHLLPVFLLGFSSLAGVAQAEGAPVRKVNAEEYSLGEAAARRDLKQGKIVYEIVGEPCVIDEELRKIALRDYGIVVKFHGCVAGPRIDYDRGYLDTVIAHLKKKHSFDPVMKLERELRERGSGLKAEGSEKPGAESKGEAQPKTEAAPR